MDLKGKGVGKWGGCLGQALESSGLFGSLLGHWQACGYVAGKQLRDVNSRAQTSSVD